MYLKKICKITLEETEKETLLNACKVLSSLESLFNDYALDTKEWNEDRIFSIRFEINKILTGLINTEYIIESED